MFKKIKSLTNIFAKDFLQRTKLIDPETNKKTIWFWMIIILAIAMVYISNEAIIKLKSINQPEIFLNLYMVFLFLLVTFQTIAISTNIYFFSKDLEFVMPLPIEPKILLISKFNTIIILIYVTEALFGFIPLVLYGFLNFTTFGYFLWTTLFLLFIPIIIASVISFLTIILMRLFGFIKSKIIVQNLVTFILIFSMIGVEYLLFGNLKNIQEDNKIISYITSILCSKDFVFVIKNLFFIILIALVVFNLFIYLSKKNYLKIILKSLSIGNGKVKNIKRLRVKNNKVAKSYIKKEFKNLIKHPIFFMETILPVIMAMITIVMLANVLIPAIDSTIQADEEISTSLASLSFNSEMICVILGILQVLFSISSLSVTAFSRDGKEAIFTKYIPLSLYKQFLYKNVLQIILNTIVSAVTLILIYNFIPKIGLINIILIFGISIIINLINSFLMVVIDLRKPYLNWNSEHSVVKKNDNKSFQYALTVIMILLYMYISSIFKELNVTLTLCLEGIILLFIFIIINVLIKKNIKKLFNKIN